MDDSGTAEVFGDVKKDATATTGRVLRQIINKTRRNGTEMPLKGWSTRQPCAALLNGIHLGTSSALLATIYDLCNYFHYAVAPQKQGPYLPSRGSSP